MVQQNLAYIWGALGLIMIGWGYSQRARRTALWFGGISAVCAAACAYYDSFWGMVCLGIFALWGLISAQRWVDSNWRFRAGLIFGIVCLAGVSLWPTVSAMTDKLPLPQYIKERVDFQLVAGLDLRGGLRLVYTVEVDEAVRDRRDRMYEDMRLELSKAFDLHDGDDRPDESVYKKLAESVQLTTSKSESNRVDLVVKPDADPAKIDAPFLNQFSPSMAFSRSQDERSYTFHLKESAESEIRTSAVNQAKEIILRRVDELGLKEAAVSTRDEDIIVEVPGQDEATFDDIRRIISQTARLEFKLLDDSADFFGPVSRNTDNGAPAAVEFQGESPTIGVDEEGDEIRTTTTYAFYRLDQEAKETSQEGLATFKAWTSTLEMPLDRELGFELVLAADPDTGKQFESGWRTYFLKSRVEISGDQIRDAQATPDASAGGGGGWYVSLRFTDAGGSNFERITGANIKRRFAIILDERVESAPVIQTRIAGGNASITMGSGDFQKQLEDSRALELVLRSGALPAPIAPSNEQHIGPSLGESSIKVGVRAALVGALIVLAFMFLYYSRAGFVANLAVATNLFLQMAILASLGASMTLPGIAGLALVIGMSVDSNVLINERIREELRDGRSPRAAVELGYGKAISAIVDGHLTTFISAVVLAQFGTGPIKGFAITLMVGVATSIFTGVMVSRLLFDFWVRGMDRSAKLKIG